MCFTTADGSAWESYVAARRCETNRKWGGNKPRPELGRHIGEDARMRAGNRNPRVTVGRRVLG